MAGQITTQVQQQVASLYVSLLGRNPDSTGFGFWTNSLANAGDTLQAQDAIAIGFSASPEFISVYGGQTTAQAVNLMYTNILGRAPDANGAAYWASVANNLIANGTPVGQAYALTGYQLIWTAANNGSSDSAAVNAKITAAVNQGSIPGVTTTLTVGGNTPTFTTGTTVPAGSLILNDVGGGAVSLAMPAGATVAASLLTVNGATTDAITADISGSAWSTVATATINGGGAETITGSAVQGLKVNDTISSVAATTAAPAITVNGGLNNSLNISENDGGNATVTLLGQVTAGGVTADAGSTTLTETVTTSGATPTTLGAIAVTATTGATVNVTRNEGVAATAGSIAVTSTTGNVTVNETVNLNKTTAETVAAADAITVTGGTTVVVNETVSQIQTATAVNTLSAEGAVTVNGNANTTTVTVNQAAVVAGAIVTTAVAAKGTTGVTAVTAAPGLNATAAVTAVANAAAVAAVATGIPSVTVDGAVTIADKNAASPTAANTITTVSLTNYGDSLIESNALTTLNLAGTGGTLSFANANTAARTAAASVLNLTTNGLKATGSATVSTAFADVNNEIATLNIVNTGTSTITSIADTNAALVLNVSGAGVLTTAFAVGTVPAAINVSGAAGYTGVINVATTFNAAGSTGVDKVTITAVPTAAHTVTGSGVAGSEIILGASSATFTTTAALAALKADVTGFNVLGITNATATYDMSKLSSSFNALDINNGGTSTFTNVVAGTTVSVGTTGQTVNYTLSDVNGPTDSVTLTIAGGTAGLAANTFVLADTNGNGIGTVNVVSNASTFNTGSNGITLTDAGITTLNVSGTGALAVTAYADSATTLTLNNTSTNVPAAQAAPTAGYSQAQNASLSVVSITDATLGALTFAGTGATTVTTLVDSANVQVITSTDTAPVQIGTLTGGAGAHSLTFGGTGNIDVGVITTSNASVIIANTGTGTVSVADGVATGFVDANITSLTLSGNVAFGANSATATTAIGGVNLATVSAGTDNAHINLTVGAVATGTAATYTFGNGNDFFTSGSVAGQLTVTVGTGYNLIDLSAGGGTFTATQGPAPTANATYAANVILGAHTSTATLFDQINVGVVDIVVGGGAGAWTFTAVTSSANTNIAGVVAGDVLNFRDAAISVVTLTAPQLANAAALGTLAAAVAYVDGLAVAHSATAFAYGANTYVLESVAPGTGTVQNGDALVQLVGTHTLTTGAVTGGLVHIAS